MGKLQIAMSESELERIYKIMNLAMPSYQLETGDKYNYRTTIVRIFEEFGKWKGFVNGDTTLTTEIELIKNDPDELRVVEQLANNYKRSAHMETERAIMEVIYRIDPKFVPPTESAERKSKILSVLEDKLGVV